MTLEYRQAELALVAGDGPAVVLEGRILPYDTETQLKINLFERFEAGSLAWDDQIPLRYEHQDVIGLTEVIESREDGVYARFRVSDTALGRDVAVLTRDGALTKFSIGFLPITQYMDENTVVRTSAELKEVSIVGVPAYKESEILSVRHDQQEDQVAENENAAPEVVEDTSSAELLAEVRSLREELLTRDIPEPTPEVSGSARGHQYRSIGEFIVDVAARRQGDKDAEQRLGAVLEAGQLQSSPTSDVFEVRAFTTTEVGTTADATGLLTAQSDNDLVRLVREARPFANSVMSGSLPPVGISFTGPSVSDGALIDYHTENTKVANNTLSTAEVTIPIPRLAGGQGVSTRVRDRSNPNYLTEVVEDHVRAYGEKLDFELINGTGSDNGGAGNAGEHTGVLSWTGVGTVAFTSGTPLVSELYAAVGEAAAACYIGHNMWPDYVAMHPRRWGWVSGASDTTNRPLLPPASPQNPVGTGDVRVVGQFAGVPVILDRNIPTNLGTGTDEDVVIVYPSSTMRLYENSPSPVQLSLTYPDTLNIDLSVHGDSAFRIRRPAGVQVIGGTGLVAP